MRKDIKSFRLEPLTCRQLQELSEFYGCSQAKILDDLVYYYYQCIINEDPYFSNDKLVVQLDSVLSRKLLGEI